MHGEQLKQCQKVGVKKFSVFQSLSPEVPVPVCMDLSGNARCPVRHVCVSAPFSTQMAGRVLHIGTRGNRPVWQLHGIPPTVGTIIELVSPQRGAQHPRQELRLSGQIIWVQVPTLPFPPCVNLDK